MPYPTFFNLPEAKRQRLMGAVWQEFTTVSYMDASINKIIQTAGISRGSFYQYFSGKQDVFAYLLQTCIQSAKEMFLAQLTVHGNDLFAAIPGVYDLLLWRKNQAKCSQGQARIFKLIRLNTELDLRQFAEQLDLEALAQGAMELLEATGYPVESREQCFAVLHMLVGIGLFALTDTMRHPAYEARNRQLLERQLDIIRRGIMKEGTPHAETQTNHQGLR